VVSIPDKEGNVVHPRMDLGGGLAEGGVVKDKVSFGRIIEMW
jgi:hypothetical protein